ncbi:MAG: DUF4062 domain-containing protein [Actinomycetia bacterium]|nr:DUF4062 domain-containing protein [Actinomycetes bacterium]
MILTPDQRLRVFVSSTLGELAAERVAVRAAIEGMRLVPVMFEIGARPHPPRALYRAYLEQSHVFLAVYAERYGWVAPGMDVSGLEDEYRLSGDRPKLVYVREPAPGRDPALTRMLSDVAADPAVLLRTFGGVDELAALVAEDLARTLAAQFASARASVEPVPGATPAPPTLPVATSPLVGRTRELAEVEALLRRPDVRLVTVTGVGGIGKSRFALEVAHRLRADFPGGVVLVPLAVVPEAGLVLTSIASALDVQLDAERPALDAVADALADRGQLLLVLDNAEHVVDAADDLAGLVGLCPEITLLVTSRKRLRLVAEHDYVLPPLDVGGPPLFGFAPDELAGPAGVPRQDDSDAVRLFLARARAARPDLRLDDPVERHAVAALCRRLDGLPLAIEIAAARVRLLTPSALLRRLDHRLDLPPAGFADLPERQRTLRATLDWSWDLLRPAEQDLLAQLSTFVGGASLEAAERVCRYDGDLVEGLATLADHSLLEVDATAVDAPRFRMLETVREYGRARLVAGGQAGRVDAAHTAWVVDLAERARAALPGAAHAQWLERLELEAGNVRAAGARAAAAGDPETLAHVGFCLWLWLWVRHHAPEATVWLERALADPHRMTPLTHARLLWALAAGAFEQGRNDQAESYLAEAERRFTDLQDAEGLDLVRFLQASLAPLDAQHDRAVALFDECVASFLRQGNAFVASVSASTAGIVLAQQGRLDDAEQRLEQALELAARIDNDLLLGQGLVARGFARLARGSLDGAATDLADGARRAHACRNAETLSFACDGLAAVRLASGQPDEAAAELIGAAFGLRERTGIAPWPVLRPVVAAVAEAVRAGLGPAGYDPAWDRGRRRDLDAVLDLVAGQTSLPRHDPVGAPSLSQPD